MAAQDKSVPQVVGELKDLTIDYVKQETIDPLRNAGRFLAFGVGGSLLLGVGLGLLALAGLRALQTETGSRFTGNWSWAPYLIVLVGVGVFAGLSAWAITRRKEL